MSFLATFLLESIKPVRDWISAAMRRQDTTDLRTSRLADLGSDIVGVVKHHWYRNTSKTDRASQGTNLESRASYEAAV